jgi:hypothetical protein
MVGPLTDPVARTQYYADENAPAMGRPVAASEQDAPWIVLVVSRVEHAVSLFADLGEIGVLR